ncbi:MAG: hypothetical protein IT381_23265 [Deltaproteobacteria bacterium]|nr:hypothetical protein [Deltaproteobacteria bacterium]
MPRCFILFSLLTSCRAPAELTDPSAGDVLIVSERTELGAGEHVYRALHVGAGAVLVVTGDARFEVTEDSVIEGALEHTGCKLELGGSGSYALIGRIEQTAPIDADGCGVSVFARHTLGRELVPVEIAAPSLTMSEPTARLLTSPSTCRLESDRLFVTVAEETTFRLEGDEGAGVTWTIADVAQAAVSTSLVWTPAAPGAYRVVAATTACAAEITVVAHAPAAAAAHPAIAIALPALPMVAGAVALVARYALSASGDAASDDPTIAWSIDGVEAGAGEQLVTALAPGVHRVVATLTEPDGQTAVAAGQIDVVAETTARSAARQAATDPCAQAAAVHFRATPAQAVDGRSAGSVSIAWAGSQALAGTSTLVAQIGAGAASVAGQERAIGQAGGIGGAVSLTAKGRLVVCSGAALTAGDGGAGGDVSARAPAGGFASATAGPGGRGGPLRLVATGGVDIRAGATLRTGSGGRGGDAEVSAEAGVDACARTAQSVGGSNQAVGARGGAAGDLFLSQRATAGALAASVGGRGGGAIAEAGDGGVADPCDGLAESGAGGAATARAGEGGLGLLDALGLTPVMSAGRGGDAGQAQALAGDAGVSRAASLAPCDGLAQHAVAAAGGDAVAVAARPGLGLVAGAAALSLARGGSSGAATALGVRGCDACGDLASARPVLAEVERGGHATVIDQKPRRLAGPTVEPTLQAKSGAGGKAKAVAGPGGTCFVCQDGPPGDGIADGRGGHGARAEARAGSGGDAQAQAAHAQKLYGPNGVAEAVAGGGGVGAVCAPVAGPGVDKGGPGGNGGNAKARAGQGLHNPAGTATAAPGLPGLGGPHVVGPSQSGDPGVPGSAE